MLLAIDVGNTNIVLGRVCGEKIDSVSRIATNKLMTADEYAVKIKDILSLYKVDVESLDGAIISSVVPPVTGVLKRAVNMIIGKDPMVVGPGVKTGLNIKIDNPAQLGSDLVVDAVATIAKYPLPAVVIDMGTATTCSVIAKNGDYLGTMIIPGLGTSLQALSSNTAQLPNISLDAPPKVIGTNTIDAMRSGVIFGNAAQLDGLIDRIENEIGESVTVVATGGLSALICNHCRHKVIHDDTLLLRGLDIIYRKNKKA